MSHLIFTTSFLPIPQSSPVPDDEQAVRGHPANRSLSKHPSVLCGSDLITVPGPTISVPAALSAATDRHLAPAAIEDYSPSSPPAPPASRNPHFLRSAQQFYELGGFYELHLLIFFSPPFPLPFLFYSNRHFCRQLSQLIFIGCPTGNCRA